MAYIIMFITAFSSATLIPMGSEAVLLYHITQGHNLYFLFATAVVANTLGSYVNYYLGYKGEEYLIRKKYLRENKIKKHKKTFGKYGGLALLLAWVPIIGDGLTFVAGILQYSVKKFFIFVFISKFFRYLVVILIFKYYT